MKALVCHIELNCIFISPKPECITQQNYTASKKYDPRCSSGVIASLPWLVPEVKVRWRGSRPYGTLRTEDIEDSDVEDATLRTGDIEDRRL